MKSPIYPKHDSEFDPQLDFAQFLKEAKGHGNELKQDAAAIMPHSSEVGATASKQLDEGTKKKRSWKNSLFSWLKSDKKPVPESNKLKNNSKVKRINLSGPINGGATLKTRNPNSGPLTAYFKATKRMEDKVPLYVCLNSSRVVHSYGPVYMVS